MTSIFTHQLQPFEENQSPSPVDELQTNPFDLHYARSRSPPRGAAPSGSPPASSPPKLSPVNDLQRQLSGDTESPPPAWKRRPSFSQSTSQVKRSTSQYGPTSTPPVSGRLNGRSPSDGGYSRSGAHLPSRRHPGLMMTASTTSPRELAPGMFLHDSPSQSSTSLQDPAADLGLPQPAFRRRPGSVISSNRSSTLSNLDISGMTSEDLWTLEHDVTPDMSNPNRQAAERPLDTVRRMSRMSDRPAWNAGLPGDVIWPTVMPVADIIVPPVKSKSFTNVPALNRKTSKLDRKASKRQQSIDGMSLTSSTFYVPSKTDPNTPVMARPESMVMSSADSSETSLTSPGGMPLSKSHVGLGSRPPSAYYSRDFLSSLAPREGGYAIAAMMGGGLGAVGTMSVDDRRRSGNYDEHRQRPPSRAPTSKSAGMGRWSLDGGEHYSSRPYMGGSPATTSSNLTGVPITSPEPSPPTDDSRSPSASYLPEGASPPVATSTSVLHRLDVSVPSLAASTSSPIHPSPLSRSMSQATSAKSPPAQPASIIPPPPPIPAETPKPALSPKKSKKELQKEAKAESARLAKEKADAAKAAAMRTLKERQEADKLAAEKKAKEKEAAAKAEIERKAKYAQMKEDAKRKEKEEKERKKAEKEAAKIKAKEQATVQREEQPKKSSAFGLSAPSLISVPSALSFSRRASTTDVSASASASTSTAAVPPVPAVPAELGGNGSGSKPFPPSATQSAPKLPIGEPRKAAVSAPLAKLSTSGGPPSSVASKKKFGFLGTIKKRFSIADNSSLASRADSPAGPTPPPKSPVTPKTAQNSGSSADTAMPPTPTPKASMLNPANHAPAPEEAVVIITAEPSASPAPLTTPTRSPMPQSQGLSPPSAYPASMDVAARPPRSSSYHASPRSINTASVPSADEIPTVSPASSVRRSVHGPRPMPTRARSHSATSRSSITPSIGPAPAAPSATASAAQSPASSFPFHVPSGIPPSTPGESFLSHTQSHVSSSTGSNGQTVSDLASPFGTDSSRKSSMTSADDDLPSIEAIAAKDNKDKESPARESSNDTIHPGILGAITVESGPVIAAH